MLPRARLHGASGALAAQVGHLTRNSKPILRIVVGGTALGALLAIAVALVIELAI